MAEQHRLETQLLSSVSFSELRIRQGSCGTESPQSRTAFGKSRPASSVNSLKLTAEAYLPRRFLVGRRQDCSIHISCEAERAHDRSKKARTSTKDVNKPLRSASKPERMLRTRRLWEGSPQRRSRPSSVLPLANQRWSRRRPTPSASGPKRSASNHRFPPSEPTRASNGRRRLRGPA
jgi:hypothetical protein